MHDAGDEHREEKVPVARPAPAVKPSEQYDARVQELEEKEWVVTRVHPKLGSPE